MINFWILKKHLASVKFIKKLHLRNFVVIFHSNIIFVNRETFIIIIHKIVSPTLFCTTLKILS